MALAQEINMDEIIEVYNHAFKTEKKYPFKAYITDDIYFSRLELCNSDSDRHMVEWSKNLLKSFNGLLVQPDEFDSLFYILIKQNSSNDTNIYCKTFSHEYSHMIDYYEYKEKYNIANMRSDEIYFDFECFQFYSEVRARFRGSLIFYQLVNVENDVLIKDYEDFLIPAYKDKLRPGLIFSDHYQKMYMLAQFYGQFLAIGCKTGSMPTLPDYIKDTNVIDLLLEITCKISDTSIFENYELISNLYSEYLINK